MLPFLRSWIFRHPHTWEFLLFNLLANIATITNFAVLYLGNVLVFRPWSEQPFSWGPFRYTVADGGLGGFLSFLASYACAQLVNFIVQRKLVFRATNALTWPIVIYCGAVIAVYLICLAVPPLIIPLFSPLLGRWAPYGANVVNILIQVVILYPVMKFFIMKR